jgi:hypothetical protein
LLCRKPLQTGWHSFPAEGEKLWKLQTTHTFRLRREGVPLFRQSFSTEYQSKIPSVFPMGKKKALLDSRASRFFQPYLGRGYIICTRAFFALADLEVDLLVFIKSCIAACLDFRMMDEQICAAVIRTNKPKSFVRIEPLYCTFTH